MTKREHMHFWPEDRDVDAILPHCQFEEFSGFCLGSGRVRRDEKMINVAPLGRRRVQSIARDG